MKEKSTKNWVAQFMQWEVWDPDPTFWSEAKKDVTLSVPPTEDKQQLFGKHFGVLMLGSNKQVRL